MQGIITIPKNEALQKTHQLRHDPQDETRRWMNQTQGY